MIRRWANSRPLRTLLVVTATASVVVALGLAAAIDTDELGAGLSRGSRDPLGLGLIPAALLAAFTMRAQAWRRLLPGLRLGQALAAVHLALGANHVLPFRLGEPLRIASVTRRTGIEIAPATATTVLLRAADVVTLALLGVAAAPGLVSDNLGRPGVALMIAIGLIGVAAALVLVNQRTKAIPGTRPPRLPDAATFALVIAAWLAEALVVWRVAQWFEIDLGPRETLAVLAAAVTVQILAVTPGGVGTYEAAGTAALVATGVPASTAITAVVVLHGVKTLYSFVAGGVALIAPQPSMLGRLRLPPPVEPVPTAALVEGGTVVLLLPAHNEGPRIREVIASAPSHIDTHPVEVVVINDGSTDDTAAVARAAGPP